MQFDNFLQGFEVGEEGFSAQGSDFVGGHRFSSGEAFIDPDVVHAFQHFQVAGQVAVGEFQGALQVVEGNPVVDRQDGHHPEPDLVVKGLIELADDVLHFAGLLGSRSWTKYI